MTFGSGWTVWAYDASTSLLTLATTIVAYNNVTGFSTTQTILLYQV